MALFPCSWMWQTLCAHATMRYFHSLPSCFKSQIPGNAMRVPLSSFLFIVLLTFAASTSVLAEDRLDDELFGEDTQEPASEDETAADPFAESPAGAASADMSWDEAPQADIPVAQTQMTRAELMQRVSAGVSAGCGAFAVSLAGSGAAFAHAGLWTLAPTNMDLLVGLGFGLLPVVGAASGAALGSTPFVEPLGVAVSSGAAALGAGLGALTGWGLGSVIAGDQASTKLPAENAYSAIVLTTTTLVASVGAAAGAAIAAPFFPAEDVE